MRSGGTFGLATPVWTPPVFSVAAIVSLALPLFVVTMASQNLPGVAAIRSAGYRMPISKLITVTGVAMLVLAPFGAFALCLSAITAAICMGREAHEDPARRYTAAVCCGRMRGASLPTPTQRTIVPPSIWAPLARPSAPGKANSGT